MTESRQLAVAASLLIPFAVTAMAVASRAATTLSSMPLLLAGWYLSAFGVVLYFSAALGLFLLLVQVAKRHANQIGILSVTVHSVSLVAVATWFIASWSYGDRYQGYFTTVILAWLNVVSAVAVLGGFIIAGRNPSFRANVVAHWCLVVWLFSWAFPYFGEYP